MKFKMGNFISLSRRVCAQILARRPPEILLRAAKWIRLLLRLTHARSTPLFSHSRQMMFYVLPSKFVPSAAADTKKLQIEMRLSTQCMCDVRSLWFQRFWVSDFEAHLLIIRQFNYAI
jgi:hypothetical protein